MIEAGMDFSLIRKALTAFREYPSLTGNRLLGILN